MKLIINGKEKEVANVSTVAELLAFFKLEKEKVAVELNKDIKNRDDFEKITIKENDKLEIITLVGGG